MLPVAATIETTHKRLTQPLNTSFKIQLYCCVQKLQHFCFGYVPQCKINEDGSVVHKGLPGRRTLEIHTNIMSIWVPKCWGVANIRTIWRPPASPPGSLDVAMAARRQLDGFDTQFCRAATGLPGRFGWNQRGCKLKHQAASEAGHFSNGAIWSKWLQMVFESSKGRFPI